MAGGLHRRSDVQVAKGDSVTATDHDQRALLAAVLENPAADLPRLIYADWLDEPARAGTVECGVCKGDGSARQDYASKWPLPCTFCSGTGRVSNGNAQRAEFVRVQCDVARLPEPAIKTVTPRPDDIAHQHGYCPECRKAGVKTRCRYHALRKREWALFQAHWKDWFPELGVPGGWLGMAGSSPNLTGNAGEYIIQRGFVAEVRAPLGVLFGGEECENCGGFGEFRRRHDNGDGPEGPCPDCGGKWNSGPHDDSDSYWDRGTGRTPGIAPALWGTQPVETCVLTDREPAHLGTDWIWFRGLEEQSGIPQYLWDHFGPLFRKATRAHAPTREAALAALSRAAVNYGRSRAGLAPLP
jgi:uncharacterized protein (TIGR02996 family)